MNAWFFVVILVIIGIIREIYLVRKERTEKKTIEKEFDRIRIMSAERYAQLNKRIHDLEVKEFKRDLDGNINISITDNHNPDFPNSH